MLHVCKYNACTYTIMYVLCIHIVYIMYICVYIIYVYMCVHVWIYIHHWPSRYIPSHFFHYLRKIYTSVYSQHCWFRGSHFDTFSLTKIPWGWSISNLVSDRKHLEPVLNISLVHQKTIATTNTWNKEEMINKWLHRRCLYHKPNDLENAVNWCSWIVWRSVCHSLVFIPAQLSPTKKAPTYVCTL